MKDDPSLHAHDNKHPVSQRVFVTGGTGVIGRGVVRRLSSDGYAVTVLARSMQQHALLTSAGIASREASMLDRDSLARAFDGHDTVINLATHIPKSSVRMLMPGAWRLNDQLRRDGSSNVLYAAQLTGVHTYIQESFAPMYADNGDQWIDEKGAVRPAPYNRTTLDAEASANQFTNNGGRGIVLRFAGFYGPDASHVRDFIRAVRMGWAPLPGSPDAYWSSIHHEDASASVIAALQAPAGTYNVTDDEPLRRRDFFAMLADASALKPPRMLPGWLTAFMGTTGELLSRSQRISNGKFGATTGWKPQFPSARDGFAALAMRWNSTAD